MQLSGFKAYFFAALLLRSCALASSDHSGGHHHKGHHHKGHHKGHHHKHHHRGHHHGKHRNATENAVDHGGQKLAAKASAAKTVVAAKLAAAASASRDDQLVAKMKALELHLAEKKRSGAVAMQSGHVLVNGPLPADFKERFSQAVSHATGIDAGKVTVTGFETSAGQPDVVGVDFKAPPKVVAAVASQSADPRSKLSEGSLHSFLVAKSYSEDEDASEPKPVAPAGGKGIDIDTAMPYGDLEPFGREDTAQELTESSVTESNGMIDQLERAEVAEEKRSVFRALTRLRGAAITSFDGVARSQTGNIDEYNKIHQWRQSHPLHHLANEESDVAKWAFPNNADF